MEFLFSFSWSLGMIVKMRNFPILELEDSPVGLVVVISVKVGYCWVWSLIIFLSLEVLFKPILTLDPNNSMWGGLPPNYCCRGVQGGQRQAFGAPLVGVQG